MPRMAHISRSQTPHGPAVLRRCPLVALARQGCMQRRRCRVLSQGHAALWAPLTSLPVAPHPLPGWRTLLAWPQGGENVAVLALRRLWLPSRSAAGAHSQPCRIPPALFAGSSSCSASPWRALPTQQHSNSAGGLCNSSTHRCHTGANPGACGAPRYRRRASTHQRLGRPGHGPGVCHVTAAGAAAAVVHARQAAAQPAAGHKPHHLGGTQAQG